MISAGFGLALIFAALLVGRTVKIGTRMRPVPWWSTDNMCAHLLAPGIVTMVAGGLAVVGSAVATQGFGVLGFASLAGIAASIAVFVPLWRALAAWSRRVDAAAALAAAPVATAAQNDPSGPPGAPTLKKAA